MPGFALDTSCMIAAVCGWHQDNACATAEIVRRLTRHEAMIVPASALVEAYAVLTRLPPPHRLAPADAVALLEANFVTGAKIVALDAASYRTLLRDAPSRGVAGGRTYDAVILAAAFRARARVLLTFNDEHFLSLAQPGIDIIVPA